MLHFVLEPILADLRHTILPSTLSHREKGLNLFRNVFAGLPADMQQDYQLQDEGRFGLVSSSYKPKAHRENNRRVARYFTRYLGTEMAKTMADMHNKGVVHGFPHLGNWSSRGKLVDYDSPHGELLGDAPITESDIAIRPVLYYVWDTNTENV